MNQRVETMWDPLALTYTMTGGARGMPASEAIRENRVTQALYDAGVSAQELQQANTVARYTDLLKAYGVHDQGLPFDSKDTIQQRLENLELRLGANPQPAQPPVVSSEQDQKLAARVEWVQKQDQTSDNLYSDDSDEEDLDSALASSRLAGLEPLAAAQVEAAENQADVHVGAAVEGDDGEGGGQVNQDRDPEGNSYLLRGRAPIPTNSRPGGSTTQWGVQSYGVIPNPSVYAGQIREAAVLRRHIDDAQYVRPEFAPQEQFFSTPVVGPAPYLGGIYA